MKKMICFFVMLFITGILSQSALAEINDSKDLPWERFSFRLGGYITDLNSELRIGSGTLGAGVSFDVEDTLGIESSMSVFRADTMYRFGRSGRHQVDFTYYDFRRDATKKLDTDIEWGDHTYPIGTTVNSFLNIRVFKGSYSYAFFQDDRFRISGSFGLYVMPIDTGIIADGIGAEEEDIIAPLPVFGIKGDFALTPKLFLKHGFEVFYLEYENFKGSIVGANIDLEYHVWKNVGFGIGVETFRLEIEAEGEDYPEIDFIGELKYNYLGLLLYTKVYF
jgi:hypothetical protein